MKIAKALLEVSRIPKFHKRLKSIGTKTPWSKVPYGNNSKQYYLCAKQKTKAPLAIWFHGGGWHFGSPEKLSAYGDYFYNQGYNVCLPSHRRFPYYNGHELLSDVYACLEQIGHSFSNSPILLGGISSGGHLASLAALSKEKWLRNNCDIEGLILCGAPLSLDHLNRGITLRRFAGKGLAGYKSLDPIRQLDFKPTFPAVVIHGTEDGLVPWACGKAFADKAQSIGWKALKFVSIPGGKHLDSACFLPFKD